MFDDMIADVLSNKKINLMVTELFIRSRKLIISLVCIAYFAVPKSIRLTSRHYFIMRIQTNENLNKLHLVIQHLLTFKTLQIYIKNIL